MLLLQIYKNLMEFLYLLLDKVCRFFLVLVMKKGLYRTIQP